MNFGCARIEAIGVDDMANTTYYSTKLCNYIIESRLDDLFVIFQTFSDNVSDPNSNIFFIQNEILDKMLTNIQNCKRSKISYVALYKEITSDEKEMIAPLDIDNMLEHDNKLSQIIDVEYFDEKLFLETVDEELKDISSKYNLNADDDYNKLYKFLCSINLMLQSSDDVLNTLTNQYVFFYEHSNRSPKNCKDEFISIYKKKIFKIDILINLIEKYKAKIEDKENNHKIKNRGR